MGDSSGRRWNFSQAGLQCRGHWNTDPVLIQVREGSSTGHIQVWKCRIAKLLQNLSGRLVAGHIGRDTGRRGSISTLCLGYRGSFSTRVICLPLP